MHLRHPSQQQSSFHFNKWHQAHMQVSHLYLTLFSFSTIPTTLVHSQQYHEMKNEAATLDSSAKKKYFNWVLEPKVRTTEFLLCVVMYI